MVDNSAFLKGIKDATIELIQLQTRRVTAAAEFLKGKSIEEAPSDTGHLRIRAVSDVRVTSDEIIGMVGNTADYAPYVHQGTGIYAKDGKGRKTPWTYRVMYGPYKGWYRTKGQKPNPFLERAREKSMPEIKRLLGVK